MEIEKTAATLQRKITSKLSLNAISFSREQQILAALVMIGAVLRLLLLGYKSIWLDEAFSLTISQRSLVDVLRMAVRTDTHPPLYYILLKFWMGLGEGEAAVRLLSALFSIASIPVMYKLATSLYRDRRFGLLGAAILTFSPFQVWYAQEARMYAMLTFFVLLSATYFFQALQSRRRNDWIGYSIATLLALYTDNGAIWYVIMISAFYLISIKRFPGSLKDWFLASAGIGLLYLPWLPFLWMQTRQVTSLSWLPPPSFQALLETFLDFHSYKFPYMEVSLLYMALIFVWAYIVPKREWQLRLASLWLFLPLAISLLLSLRQPIFLSRNLIAASLGYYLLVAGTIWRFRSTKATLALLLPLVAMNLVSIGHNTWVEQKEDWRAVAQYVAVTARDNPGGLVVFLPRYTELPFQYYFQRTNVSVDTQGYPGDEVLLHPEPKQVEDIAKMLEDRPYVWLVVRDTVTDHPDPSVKEWLDTHGFIRQKDLVREDITVLMYVRWDKATTVRLPKEPQKPQTEFKMFAPMVSHAIDVQVYVIKPGETLLEIAVRYGTTVQSLMELNDLKDPDQIAVGQELLIPKGTAGGTSTAP